MDTPPPQDSRTEPAPPASGCGRDAPSGRPPGGEVAVVGVRLHGQARISQFNSGDADYEIGETVVVEGDQGSQIGCVAQPTARARKLCGIGCMKRVLRAAAPGDIQTHDDRVAAEKEAGEYCRARIRERSLPMKLVQVTQSNESRKLIFGFTAESRVDFRDLVKELAQRLHTRIEMRQIGVRDEAGIRGGYGPCGKALCCSTFLTEFAPISIKMAKAQNLNLNPSKLSGMCGRLKCCLRYEYEPAGGDPGLAPEDEPLPPAPQEGPLPPAAANRAPA
jgi:cell fate regulator YaaT (PSP1 superfamily)